MPLKTRSDRDEKSSCGDDKCGHCLKLVSEQDGGVMCDICSLWFHNRCQGVSESMYKALKQFNKELYWFCKDCRQGADRLLPSIATIHSKVDRLDDEATRASADLKSDLTRTIAALADLKNEIVGIGGRMELYEKKSEENKLVIENIISSKLVEMEVKLLNKDVSKWSGIVSKELETTVGADLKSLQKTVEEAFDSKTNVHQTLDEVVRSRLDLHCKRNETEKAEEKQRRDEEK